MKYVLTHCEPLEHDWEIEEVSGNGDSENILLKFKCIKCGARLEGKVKR
tara:strand:+ start:4262 stop:4408 length:147 start_codon:yes stop_codon:yes gene_type:complete